MPAHTPDPRAPFHLAVALDGAGWHPVAWREPAARPADLFTAGYWLDLVGRADSGLVDFVTLEDGLGMQSWRRDGPDERTDQVRGRLDAVLVAARVAPATRSVGLVPTVIATHTEPFHISKAVATLDYVSDGRAGVRVQVSGRPADADHFGRRTILGADAAGLMDEAADYVEVVRRLWDSWEDDAEIRDATTGRFIDRDKLHYIDFEGRWFSVRGPSITPRPPQGQPLVTVLAHSTVVYRLGARAADVVFVTPHGTAEAAAMVAEVRGEQAAAGRAGDTIHVFADVVVLIDPVPGAAARRLLHLDRTLGRTYISDALILAGTPVEVADLLDEWAAAGLTGFRLRPAVLPDDLDGIVDGLVPELDRRGRIRRARAGDTLRGRLGLPRPANRYARSR